MITLSSIDSSEHDIKWGHEQFIVTVCGEAIRLILT